MAGVVGVACKNGQGAVYLFGKDDADDARYALPKPEIKASVQVRRDDREQEARERKRRESREGR